MPAVKGIQHISITVIDIERSVPWYKEVFGFQQLMDEPHPDGTGRVVLLASPDFSTMVGLHAHPTNGQQRFSEDVTGLDHVGFLVSDRNELVAWEERLTAMGVEHSPINDQAVYSVVVFRDPDNVQLEFICFAS